MEPQSNSPRIEPLEPRQLLSASVVGTPAIVNVSKMAGDQSEEAVAINPVNPQQVFIASNTIDTLGNAPVNPAGLFTAVSNDGGATWTNKVIGLGTDGLPMACCDPSLAWDNYGNLFLAYLRADTGRTELLGSNDAGTTWHLVKEFAGSNDQPTVVAGHNSVWVAFQQDPQAGVKGALKNQGAVAYGAAVTGAGRIGPFKVAEGLALPASNVGDIAIGPAGQVTVAYQIHSDVGPSTIYTRTDPDGLGPKKFGPANTQVSSNLGFFYPVPPQAVRTTDAESALAYDVSGGPYTGRLYLAYADAPNTSSTDTNIFLRYSDDNGATWSAPQRVNDDTTTASQFFPRLSVDPVTGAVGLTWYDARNDTGIQGAGGTNSVVGDDVQVYGAVGVPSANGVQFSPNFVVQPAFSNATALPVTNPPGATDPNQFGDYNGQAFYNGVLRPAWADNSNSTGDNYGGLLRSLDVYTATINVQTTPDTTGTLLGEFGDVGGRLKYTAADGSKITLSMRRGTGVAWIDPSGDLALRIVSSDPHSSVVVNGRNVTLGNVTVAGNLGSFNAPRASLAGTFSVTGIPGRVTLGNVTGGTFTSVGPVGILTVASLVNAKVLAGANLGADNALGGGDDAFVASSIDTLTVRGVVQNSFIGAGVNPVDGVLGDSADQIIGGAASIIRHLRAQSVDGSSKIEAGAFGSVLIPGPVNPATDPRFLVG